MQSQYTLIFYHLQVIIHTKNDRAQLLLNTQTTHQQNFIKPRYHCFIVCRHHSDKWISRLGYDYSHYDKKRVYRESIIGRRSSERPWFRNNGMVEPLNQDRYPDLMNGAAVVKIYHYSKRYNDNDRYSAKGQHPMGCLLVNVSMVILTNKSWG